MKYLLPILVLSLFLFACSEDHPIEYPPDIKEDSTYYFSLERYLFVELGLKPFPIDSLSSIRPVKEKDYTLLLGQRNNRAWLAKFNKVGEKLYSYELPPSPKWKYSYYHGSSIVLNNDKYLFIRGWKSNLPGNQTSFVDCDEYLLILDFQTGKELTQMGPFSLYGNYYSDISIRISNGRYLIHCWEKYNNIYNLFYVVGEDGKERYGREWTDKEEYFLGNEGGIIFIDDERVCLSFPKGNQLYSSSDYKIINLRTWQIIKKFDKENGLSFVKEDDWRNHIETQVDTVYLEDNKIKFVYDRIKSEYIKDPVSGINDVIRTHIGKYCYEIDTDTYDLNFKGEIK